MLLAIFVFLGALVWFLKRSNFGIGSVEKVMIFAGVVVLGIFMSPITTKPSRFVCASEARGFLQYITSWPEKIAQLKICTPKTYGNRRG